MTLEILSPEKSLFKGEIKSVTLPGKNGSFQILKDHAPIISSLSSGSIKVTGDENHEFQINSGFVECLKNHVVVLVEA